MKQVKFILLTKTLGLFFVLYYLVPFIIIYLLLEKIDIGKLDKYEWTVNYVYFYLVLLICSFYIEKKSEKLKVKHSLIFGCIIFLYLFAGTLSDMNNFMVNIIYDLSAVVTCYLGGLILDYFKK